MRADFAGTEENPAAADILAIKGDPHARPDRFCPGCQRRRLYPLVDGPPPEQCLPCLRPWRLPAGHARVVAGRPHQPRAAVHPPRGVAAAWPVPGAPGAVRGRCADLPVPDPAVSGQRVCLSRPGAPADPGKTGPSARRSGRGQPCAGRTLALTPRCDLFHGICCAGCANL